MLILVLFFLVKALCDVAILYPLYENYTSQDGVVNLKLEFIDDNSSPHVTEIDYFSINLCTGVNTNITLVSPIIENITLTEFNFVDSLYKKNISISDNTSSDGLYFLQIVSFWDDCLNVHYSNRFLLSNMKNTTKIFHGSSDVPPTPQTKLTQGETTTNYASFYTIPYISQTSNIKYAPMQPQVNTYNPVRWSNSIIAPSVSPYTTLGSSPNVMYTITEPPTYTLTSGYNTMKGQTASHSHYNPNRRVKAPTLKASMASHS